MPRQALWNHNIIDFMPTIQIIIPVYEDTPSLERILPDLLRKKWDPAQILVVDASETAPFPQINAYKVPVLYADQAAKGRAKQMNLGVAQSSSDLLVFLHADTILPPNARELVVDAAEKGTIFGGFSRRFDSPSRFLKWTCRLADWRGEQAGWFFGDQVLFVTRKAFDQLGGFPEIEPFEDLAFSRKLKALGPYTLLRPGIVSSARRFEKEGALLRTLKDVGLTIRYIFTSVLKKST